MKIKKNNKTYKYDYKCVALFNSTIKKIKEVQKRYNKNVTNSSHKLNFMETVDMLIRYAEEGAM